LSTKKRVFVGMSGGVDSSVSAALLKQAGYEVTGVFIKVWHPDWAPCNWKDDRLDAMRVAAHLDIPFITIDLEKQYKEKVVDYMVEEYRSGRTPNPDVMCNTFVKFGAFYDWAMENGADYVATGHYAQSINGELVESPDEGKDQTYFIWQITKEKLNKVLFPVGGFHKEQVRKLAQKFNLPNATKKDSQGLCFVGKVDLDDFLSHFIQKKTGDALNTEGEKIGDHDGAWQFTLGQRHGFTLFNKDTERKAHYVVAKDIVKNTVTVSDKQSQDREDVVSRITINSTHWISGKAPEIGETLLVRYRYHQNPIKVKILNSTQRQLEIELERGEAGIAEGQSAVFYRNNTCLGGGIIVK
jgi:tRNA-specific 2-thiouridylase